MLVNLATGGSLPKGAIMASPDLLLRIRSFISAQDDETGEEIRLAATWATINLTWPDDDGTPARLDTLRHLAFPQALHAATSRQYASIDLNDRLALALEHFTDSYHI